MILASSVLSFERRWFHSARARVPSQWFISLWRETNVRHIVFGRYCTIQHVTSLHQGRRKRAPLARHWDECIIIFSVGGARIYKWRFPYKNYANFHVFYAVVGKVLPQSRYVEYADLSRWSEGQAQLTASLLACDLPSLALMGLSGPAFLDPGFSSRRFNRKSTTDFSQIRDFSDLAEC